MVVSFIGGGNLNTQRKHNPKPPPPQKKLIVFKEKLVM
jgi:hypothetical protein